MRRKTSRRRELPARHGNGAVMEIDAERIIDGVLQHAERLHVIGERRVAKSGVAARMPPPLRQW